MNKTTVAEQLTLISEIYRQPVSNNLPLIWFNYFSELPDAFLVESVLKHTQDPDQGRFWPTPAHLLNQMIIGDAKVKLISAQEFDDNPAVDGTDSFRVANESNFDRSQRRREYISSELESWNEFSTPKKLLWSNSITQNQFDQLESQGFKLSHETTD